MAETLAKETQPETPKTRDGFSHQDDVDLFIDTLEKFERGEISPDEWRAFRLVNGVYGQRQPDVQMLRVKAPLGILTPPQLHALGDVAERWAPKGVGHITTRQNFQFHFIPLKDALLAMQHVANAGLTQREACGNSVRNVTSCAYAGVSAIEPYDVTPYGEAVVRHLLRGKYSSTLPRKFKIAFSGCCGTDCAGGMFHDIGFISQIRDGKRGFRVVAGGGLATRRVAAVELHDFAPVEEILEISEAVVRMFHRLGNRPNRNKARLKWVLEKLGAEAFIAEYRKDREAIAAEGGRTLVLPEQPLATAERNPELLPERPDFAPWRAKNVRPQKQVGYSTVTVRVDQGDISVAQFRTLARLVEQYSGEGELRTTIDQNLVFRFVKHEHVASLHHELVNAGLGLVGPSTVADVVSCPGAISCNLAVTRSPGLATYLSDYIAANPRISEDAEKLSIKISGCPNSCGQHHVSGLGWQGGVRKIAGKSVPVYLLHIGGSIGPQEATFGRLVAKVPARRSPAVLERMVDLYKREKAEGEAPDAFFARLDTKVAKAEIEDLLDINEENATPEDFIDLGEDKEFEVVIGEGECAA